MIDVTLLGCRGGWRKFAGNPVIGGKLGECFDVSVIEHDGHFRMYFSWRSQKSIAAAESADGLCWGRPEIVLSPTSGTGWEDDDVSRMSVIKKDGQFHMWYSGTVRRRADPGRSTEQPADEANLGNGGAQHWANGPGGTSSIGYATSPDGLTWERHGGPVLVPADPWEGEAVMCPHVMWDDVLGCYRMWYSGGAFYEPDAIGHATSEDGVTWKKEPFNPVFSPDPSALWEQEKTTACQVVKDTDWYVMFYIGFEDIDKARISAARSRDGITAWERHRANPLISGGRAGGWDCEAAYKPFVLLHDNRWIMYYNGRRGAIEQIGAAFHDRDLGF
jgi:beta-1,2-mannobiose phosphorylase / 1,2-beta-oligomannan phosphorylase